MHRRTCLIRAVAMTTSLAIAGPALAQLQFSNLRCPSVDALANRSAAMVGVRIDYLARHPQQLQVWVEEYPRGSGCSGDTHHTNGGRSVQVDRGSGWVDIGVPWYGASRGESYRGGFLNIGARIDGYEASARRCCPFGSEAR